MYSLGPKGHLEAEVFRRPGTLVTSPKFSVSEFYAPLLLRITDLESSTMHKIVASLAHDAQQRALASQITFANTEDKPIIIEEPKDETTIGLSKSELDVIAAAGAGHKVDVLEGRSSKNWQDFLKCGYKFPCAFADLLKDKRVKRTLIMSEAFDVFDALEEKEKTEIIDGAWFMGPVYTHDTNYQNMLSK